MQEAIELPHLNNKSLETLTVLVVEDNRVIQQVVKKLFIRAGVREENITIADNGKIAVELVEKSSDSYDVIYMDELMPEMQGPEATLKIREKEKTKSTNSIIFACSSSYDGVFPGSNTRLNKPLKFEELQEFLAKVIHAPEAFWFNAEQTACSYADAGSSSLGSSRNFDANTLFPRRNREKTSEDFIQSWEDRLKF
ncbi:sensory histidine-kinase / response regulator (plasmid) [Legionella adelaidensis]|uniref:Sensory histidine-kinase / response regulator n=1 Tax=Legionella adelaidensis TaxID=45056 RepID=A0A0W0R1P1_9GAMM|nr:response regulator [Legionella adelaidensis]KTC65009.1 sensory histidine-kinase / response regulator [Legionella adelaidensis]VEH85311.1 sensory histidine-kinase / response regulator [Legionella adelaidensis]